MTAKTDLRADIVRVASDLFMKQSYAATSIKQIASAAGCTTAALYYYFEDGKESILREVIEVAMPNLAGQLESITEADSLQALTLQIGQVLLESGRDMLLRTRWLMVEFPNLGEGERTRLHQILLQFQQRSADLIEPFVADRQQAETLAWIQYAAFFGYGQLFVTLGLEAAVEPPQDVFFPTLAAMIGRMGNK